MVAVAPAAAIIAALAALLFLLAWQQYGQFITNTLSVNLPVVGNVIGSAVAKGLEAAYQVVAGWFDSVVTPAAQFILSPVAAIENTFGALLLAAENAYNVAWSTIHVRIPQVLAQGALGLGILSAELTQVIAANFDNAVSYANQVGASAVATSASYYAQAIHYADTIGAQVTAEVVSDLALATHYADEVGASAVATATALVGDAVHYADTIGATAEGYALGLFTRAETDLGAVLTQSEAFASEAITAAASAAAALETTAISAALGGLYTDLDTAITDTTTVIGDADADIRDALGRIDLTVPRDIAGVAALAGATALTLTRFLRDCGIPQCKSLGGLVNDLAGITSILGDAAFLEFLVEMIQHPSQAGELFTDTFGALIDAGVSTAESIIGIAA